MTTDTYCTLRYDCVLRLRIMPPKSPDELGPRVGPTHKEMTLRRKTRKTIVKHGRGVEPTCRMPAGWGGGRSGRSEVGTTGAPRDKAYGQVAHPGRTSCASIGR